MKYTNHKHEWKLRYLTGCIFGVECAVCYLEVQGFNDHVSLYDITGRVEEPCLGRLYFPDPEDEEATELEPEEVTVDAEGGEV